MPTAPRKFKNLTVINVAAVSRAANKRKFLVVKHEVTKGEFQQILEARRNEIFNMLSERFSALMMAVDTTLFSEDVEDKPAAVEQEVKDFLASVKEALPKAVKQLQSRMKSDVDTTSIVELSSQLKSYIQLKGDPMSDPSSISGDPQSTKIEGTGNTPIVDKTPVDKDSVREMVKVEREMMKAELDKWQAAVKADREKLEERMKSLEQENRELRHAAKENAFRTEASDLGLDPDKDLEVIKSLHDMPKEAADRVRETMRSQKALLSGASHLMGEIGTTQKGILSTNARGIEGEIHQKVVAKMKEKDGLTYDQAQTQVFEEDPSLYDRWDRGSYAKGKTDSPDQ